MKKILLLFSIAILIYTCNKGPKQTKEITIIKGGTILDFSNEGHSAKDLADSYIIFTKDSILEVGQMSMHPKFPKDAMIIDAKGKYIMP